MRKTELEPELYELENKGCLGASIFIIIAILVTIIAWSFVSCGHVKKSTKCEAYHSGNPNR